MLKRLLSSRLFGAAGTYTAANMLNAVAPLVLLPVLTRHLDPAGYGVVAMFQVLVGIAGPLVGLNTHGAVQRRAVDLSGDALARYVGNCVGILLATAAALLLALLAFAPLVERFAGVPAEWLWSVVAVAAGQGLMMIRLALWQLEARPLPYAAVLVSRTVVHLVLAVVFVVYAGMGWAGFALGAVVASALGALVALVSLLRSSLIRLAPDRETWRHAIAFGAPLTIHSLSAYAVLVADRMLLTRLVGLEATGVYMVAAQFNMALMLVFTSFNTAYAPWLLLQLRDADDDRRLRIVRITYAYMPVALSLAIVAGAAGWVVIPWVVGSEFHEARRYLPILALSSAFNGMYLMVTNILFFAERTRALAATTAVAALLSIALGLLLIPLLGASGAALATSLAMLAKFALTWRLSIRAVPMPWFSRRAFQLS